MAVQHVPAWKRLGLQLKNATDVARRDDTNGPELKRKSRDADGIEGGSLLKKAKKGSSKVVSGTEAEDQSKQGDSGSTAVNNGPTHGKKRKSVSFADAEDLVQFSQTSAPTSLSERDEHIFQDEQEKLTADVADEERKARKLRKSELKQQRRKNSIASLDPNSETVKPRGYLDYLSRYSEDRRNWKFNKTFQSQLFRDLFDLYKVPSSYNKAISDYITGLQGVAARRRLRESARVMIRESMAGNDVSSAEAAKAVAERKQHEKDAADALARDQQLVKDALRHSEIEEEMQSIEHRLRMKKLQRAAEILRELSKLEDGIDADGTAMTSEPSNSQTAEARQQPQRARRSRGRKRRMTGISDDESSSSSDSSSSSSGSGDEINDDDDKDEDGATSGENEGREESDGSSTRSEDET